MILLWLFFVLFFVFVVVLFFLFYVVRLFFICYFSFFCVCFCVFFVLFFFSLKTPQLISQTVDLFDKFTSKATPKHSKNCYPPSNITHPIWLFCGF